MRLTKGDFVLLLPGGGPGAARERPGAIPRNTGRRAKAILYTARGKRGWFVPLFPGLFVFLVLFCASCPPLRSIQNRVHCSSALQECIARAHCRSALQECIARMHCRSALQECIAGVHCRSALQECIAGVHCKSAYGQTEAADWPTGSGRRPLPVDVTKQQELV